MTAKKRTDIPEAVSADVLYRSDHTCCVCRINRKVQIHHLDENPANHDPDNLAVLCLNCHDDTQLRGGFTRKPSALEIIQYRESWHRVVKLKLEPHDGGDDRRIFVAEVMHEVIDICHGWRDGLRYVMAPTNRKVVPDQWEHAQDLAPKTFSVEAFERLRPFFEIGLERVMQVLDRVHAQASDALTWEFRTAMLRTRRGLESEKQYYMGFAAEAGQPAYNDVYFAGYFQRALRTLRQLAQAAEQAQREQLGDDLSLYEGEEEEYDPYD